MLPRPDSQRAPQALTAARQVLEIEARAIDALWQANAEAMAAALALIADSTGRVIICGLGKSGHIGAKLAATMASLGTPTHFLHAAEALHGDFGVCAAGDVGIVISNSGTTSEVVAVATLMKQVGMSLIAMSRTPESPIGQLADVHLTIAVAAEADPLGLAPTASTTATLVLGDALAVGLSVLSDFGPDDFHARHPGGSLGQALAGDRR